MTAMHPGFYLVNSLKTVDIEVNVKIDLAPKVTKFVKIDAIILALLVQILLFTGLTHLLVFEI